MKYIHTILICLCSLIVFGYSQQKVKKSVSSEFLTQSVETDTCDKCKGIKRKCPFCRNGRISQLICKKCNGSGMLNKHCLKCKSTGIICVVEQNLKTLFPVSFSDFHVKENDHFVLNGDDYGCQYMYKVFQVVDDNTILCKCQNEYRNGPLLLLLVFKNKHNKVDNQFINTRHFFKYAGTKTYLAVDNVKCTVRSFKEL